MSAVSPTRAVALLRAAIAIAIVVLSLFPVGAWLEVELTLVQYSADGWWSGTALVGLVTGLLVWVIHRSTLGDVVPRAVAPLVHAWEQRPVVAIPIVAAVAFGVYAFDAWWIFDRRPLLIDEIVQAIQARIFTAGQLTLEAGAHPEFRSIMHLVELDGRVFGQFPPGGPAMLALGELAGAMWLVNPLFGAASVAAFALALRWGGVAPGVALGATLLFGFAPFVIFQSASHMNHVTSLTFLLMAAAALMYATRTDRASPWAGLLCGLGLGVAATIRPLDAMVWALPAGAWLLWRALRLGRWETWLASGVGVATPMAVMFWVNQQMTGDPFTFGYVALWGAGHGLGFHDAPWGEPHTLRRGIAMMAAYLNRLNDFMFETPVPVLVPVALSIAWGRTMRGVERYLALAVGMGVLAYIAYWHDGFYLGPRFLYPAAPLVALLIAQVPSVLQARWPRAPLLREGTYASFVAAGVCGVIFVMPIRIAQHQSIFTSFRTDLGAVVAAAGVRDSQDLVLIRESWGAQLIARMWAMGLARPAAEALYRSVDACVLDEALTALEADGARGDDALRVLQPLRRDSARLLESTLSPDDTERMLPGATYGVRCQQRIAEDRAGYGHFASAWLVRAPSGVRWARDLQARDTLVARRTDRVWLLRWVRDSLSPPRPVVERIDGDSLWRSWGWMEGG